MDISKLGFGISSMNNLEYRVKEITSLSSEEIDCLEEAKQVLFMSIRKDIEPVTNIVGIAPKAWFNGKEDFKLRVKGNLKEYILDVIKEIYVDGLNTIGELIDSMGVYKFINYIGDEQISAISGADPEIFDCYEIMGVKMNDLKFLTAQIVINAIACNKLLTDKNLFNKLIEDAEFIENGIVSIELDSTNIIKQSYVVRMRLTRLHNSRLEDGKESYYKDITELYSDFVIKLNE